MERAQWSMCGRGSGDHVLQAGRTRQPSPRSQFAGPCDVIGSLCLELWTSQFGYTALIGAAYYGHRDVVGLLLDRGADMEAKDNVSRPLPSSPACQGQSLASDGLNATRPVRSRGVAQWRLGFGALQWG